MPEFFTPFCRWKLCNLFVKALQKSSRTLRMKHLYDLEDLNSLTDSLDQKSLKRSQPCIGLPLDDDWFIVPGGLMFFNGTKGRLVRFSKFNNARNIVFNFF